MGDLTDDIAVVLLLVFVAATAVAGLYGLGVIEMNEDFDLGDIDLFGDDGDPYDRLKDTPEPTPSQAFDTGELEHAIADAITIARENEDIDQLNLKSNLSDVARDHSRDMIDRSFYGHTNPDGDGPQDRFDAANIQQCNEVGEAIQDTFYDRTFKSEYGIDEYGPFETVDEMAVWVVEQWLDDSDYRELVLDDVWRHMGVGVAVTADDHVYVTAMFCASILTA